MMRDMNANDRWDAHLNHAKNLVRSDLQDENIICNGDRDADCLRLVW